MAHLDDFNPMPLSTMATQFAQVYGAEVQDLSRALQWRQLLGAFDTPYAFHRSRAFARAFRLLRAMPAPQHADPFSCLALEGATGRDGSAPSVVSGALKRTFPPLIKAKADDASFVSLNESAMKDGGLAAEPTWAEKELCLRLCQGVCVLSQSQRRLAEESRLVEVVLSELDRAKALVAKHYDADSFALGVAAGGGSAANAFASSSFEAAASESTSMEVPTTQTHTAAPTTSTGSKAGAKLQLAQAQRAEALGVQFAADYRVVLSALDALEAAMHYSPATLYRLLKHSGVVTMVSILSDARHPRIVRSLVADVLATIIAETSNPMDWSDSTTSAALENDVRNALRLVQQCQEQAAAKAPSFVVLQPVSSAAQLYDALRSLRDYEGVAQYREVPAPPGGGSSAAAAISSPNAGAGRKSSAMADDGFAPGSHQHPLGSAGLRKLGTLRKDTGAALARKRKLREERFSNLLALVAVPIGECI